jgi:hypothetical protein
MIIDRPVRKGGCSTVPRHSITPFQVGGPSSGKSRRRTVEWIPSAPIRASPRTVTVWSEPSRRVKVAVTPFPSWVKSRSHGQLRELVARREAPRLTPDLLAEPVGVDQLVGPDGHPVERLEQAEAGEFPDRVRQCVDADAEFVDLPRLFVDVALDTDGVQAQRGREPADAAADHQYPHGARVFVTSPSFRFHRPIARSPPGYGGEREAIMRDGGKSKVLVAADGGDDVNGVIVKLYAEETGGTISIIEQPFEPGLATRSSRRRAAHGC